jgi:hypothetical protein
LNQQKRLTCNLAKMTNNSRVSNDGDGRPKGAVRAPAALNPEQMALVQPWKDLVLKGLVAKLTAEFTPGGTLVHVDLADHVAVPDGTGRKGLAPGIAKDLLDRAGFAVTRGQKSSNQKEQPLPARSLSAKDLEKLDEFEKRARSVANAIGSTSAVGRVGSYRLEVEGATTLLQWWDGADPQMRLKLLMDKRHYESLSDDQVAIISDRIKGLSCPFRGSTLLRSVVETEVAKDKSAIKEKEEGPIPAEAAKGPEVPKPVKGKVTSTPKVVRK